MPKSAVKRNEDYTQFLKGSPIHGITPKGRFEIELKLIDDDPTNPGANKFSDRYKRRAPDIRDSYDIIGGIVYPLVVSESGSGRFVAIDGHGRRDELLRRGVEKVMAIIFPPLTLEKRICLRQVLNAAQEAFDTPLVLRDLHLLAKERGLDIRNKDDLESLLADLPPKIRRQREKLELLAKWPLDVADKISVDNDVEAGVVGFDKVKELNGLVSAVQRNHPGTAKTFAGDKLYQQALQLYFNGSFSGRRSQDTIRDARRLLKKLPQDDPVAKKFVNGTIDFSEFQAQAEPKVVDRPGRQGVVAICKDLNVLLTDIDPQRLTAAEVRSLERTVELVSKVLSEVPV